MSEFNPKASLRITRIIFTAILLMPVLFAVVVFSMNSDAMYFSLDSENPLILALALIFLMAIPAAIIIPKKQMGQIPPGASLQKRFAAYQTAFILKVAIWEGIANFGIVLFMLEANILPVLIAALSLLLIATEYPGVKSMQKYISLNADEIRQFES